MIIGRSGRLKKQSPAEQASSERTRSGRPKQIHNAEKKSIVTRTDQIFLFFFTLLKGNHNCTDPFTNNYV